MAFSKAFVAPVAALSAGALFLAGCAGMAKEQQGQLAGMTTGGIVGGVIGNHFGGKSGAIVGAIVGTAIGGMIGYEIGKSLSEKDRKAMQGKMALGLSTGNNGQAHTWINDDKSATATYTPMEPKTVAGKARVVRMTNVQAVSSLDVIGKPYRAPKAVSLNSGPAASTPVVGKLAANEEITVFGKLTDQPWYLVGRNNVSLGYVPVAALKPSAAPDAGTLVKLETPNTNDTVGGTVAASEVPVRTTCRSMTYEISTNGSKAEEGSFAGCRQVDGNWALQPQDQTQG